MIIKMSELLREIETWFGERPKWLQDATRRIIKNGEITDADLKELVDLCKAEADMGTTTLKPMGIPLGSLNYKEEKVSLRLNTISNLTGINALSPRKPLILGDAPITIVYGQNGSGKSGYVRVLKHACGARKPGKLLYNVFSKTGTKQGCTFSITNESSTKDIEWDSSLGVHDELRTVELYDSDCANVYVNDENEVAYEPWILSLFSQLAKICDKVGQVLKDEASKQISKKPKMPDNYVSTEVDTWYNKLAYKTKQTEIDGKCIWTAEFENELIQTKKRLSEANPADKAQKLRKTKTSAENFNSSLKKIKENFDNEKCESFLLAKSDALAKRKVADEDAKKVFEGASLEGVGTDTWKLLWESARGYSEKFAYPGKLFPNTHEDAKCILCNQPLNEEARKKFISFEDFVKGEIEKQAISAEQSFKKLMGTLDNTPTGEQLNLLMDSAGVSDEAERTQIIDFCAVFEIRKNTLLNAKDKTEVSPLPSEEGLKFISEWIDSVEQQASAFEEDAKGENRGELLKIVNELEAQKWLFQQKKCVEDEVECLKLIQKYKKAQSLTNTLQLSNKKSSLSDELITNEYVKRFEEELKTVGASHIRVEMIKTKASKGHIFHQIKLKSCSLDVHTADVLSEGEFRVVSLAGFLADVEGRPNNTPFVFDDPISSLDQDFEEATVNRLIKLCEKRQVIVFTHRLSMLALLEEALKSAGSEYEVVCLRREKWGAGEPGDTPIFAKKPDKALNSLLNERLPKAKKALDEEGTEAYELIAKGICSDFRILIERLLESELLGDVVQRFRRAINTMGKIHKLAFINKEDCQLFDDFMTKYSKYEHSQSNETPVTLPEPNELQEDMKKIKSWIEEYRKRVAS